MMSSVVLNFFPAFTPASSGGELRIGNLYRAASSSMKVTLLTSTDFGARYEEIIHTDHLLELRFPKDELWREAYATLERLSVQGELSGLAFALAVSDPQCKYRQHARALALDADLVIHEFPFSEPIFSDGCPTREIYNSHNFEASLLSSIVYGDGFESALLKLLQLEGNLVARTERVFATSRLDAEKFRLFYGVSAGKIDTCPNGFDDIELQPVLEARQRAVWDKARRPRLLFTGSGHRPNVEAARFLLTLADELPHCDIVFAGGLCGSFTEAEVPNNVSLFGPFDQAAKLRLLSEADLFLNPVTLGSGTSLKALEALGAAVPMVSTAEGVRGLDLSSGVHCEICPRDEFAAAVQRLLDSEPRRRAMAAAGLAAAVQTFSWAQIARALTRSLSMPVTETKSSPPLVLALNDYAAMQPGSGGIARVRNLLTGIACDVVLLSFGESFDVGLIAPGVLHATVPKSAAHRAFENAINGGQAMSVNDGVASLFASGNRALTSIVASIAKRAQAVIFEHPYMAPLLDDIELINSHLPVIYSSHNVEATHKRTLLADHTMGESLVAFIAELERRLATRADLIVCCTEADFLHFEPIGKQLIMVPNGCTVPELEVVFGDRIDPPRERPRLGFLASAHGPNVEAAQFIIEHLAPAFPEADFEFIGSVCNALLPNLPRNIRLHGLLSEAAKTERLLTWDVALNPVESGGGSSLKLPDYMAHGLASLSTAAGARGFPVVEHDAGCVADRSTFELQLRAMLGQPDLIFRQGWNAYQLAAGTLSWSAATASYREHIRDVLLPTPAQAHRPRILVVTYRYTEPALGGAEEYLIEILKRLRSRCDRLDLAAINVADLTNYYHFSCSFSTMPASGPGRVGELFDEAHFFPPTEPVEREILRRCRDLERAWTREERHLFSPFAHTLASSERLRVFGGFFWPENHDGVIRRWTAPEFSFLVPANARVFQMSGYAAANKTLHVTLTHVAADGSMTALCTMTTAIGPHFSVVLALPGSNEPGVSVLLCKVDEHTVSSDHRPFGVLLESASVQIDANAALSAHGTTLAPLETSSADLAELIDEELRTTMFAKWVATLHRTAQHRDEAIEADFAAVRGPHSPALQTWLAEHAASYDTVLVQGIPFDIIPSTVETLSALDSAVRPRIVTLPHFHGDDRFYHWRRYAESFAKADATLLFSTSVAEQLGADARFIVVPGGGVRADEQGDPTAEQSFRAVHTERNPFLLVLGRKTLSKGYEQTIRSHQALRAAGHAIDLVLIGPDEDGRSVEGDGVFYLGRQPRNVIRGALKSCLGLVTMSRSESFGIVLCEAWLFGKPVIANRACYSFRELVEDGRTGLLVATDKELTEAMRHIAVNADDRRRMGQSGFNLVLQKYTWESVASACFNALAPTSDAEGLYLAADSGDGWQKQTRIMS